MLEMLALLFAAAPPPPAALAMPPGCKVHATETHLVVRTSGGEVQHGFGDGELPSTPGHPGPPELTVLPLPGTKDMLVASLRDRWEGVAPAGLGYLYLITCAPTPEVHIAMVAPGIDFGRVAIARDGRWIVGGWGGLRVLDANAMRLTPLTNPPTYSAPNCWSAQPDKPARAADIPIVDGSGIARSEVIGPEEIRFVRGGACGYEAEMSSTRHALLLDRGVIRRMASIVAFAATDDGRMLVGDGDGPCERQTPGVVWSSADGETWTTINVKAGGAGIKRIVQLPATAGGLWLALGGICDKGGSKRGGDLLASTDLVTWEPIAAIPEGFNEGVGGGAGIVELLVAEGRAYIAAMSLGRVHWFESKDGRGWKASLDRPMPRAQQWLAKSVGVETINGVAESPTASLVWTSDGLFRRAKRGPVAPGEAERPVDTTWTRVFPR